MFLQTSAATQLDIVMFDVPHIGQSGFKIGMHKLPNASCAFRISAIVSTVHPGSQKSRHRILKRLENILWMKDERTFQEDTTCDGRLDQ